MSVTMQHRTLGKTGLLVSPLGFGAAPIGFLKTQQEQVGVILNALLNAGVNLIDTAASYPGSEESIGKAVSRRRSEYVLVSKCGQSFADVPGEAWSEKVITATIERGLKRLQTDHLDVMLLHSCDLAILKKGEAFGALLKARDAGKIRFAGYSGDNEAVVYAAGMKDMAVIETSINIVDQANIDGLLPLARKNNIGVIAKRPIANGCWRPIEAQRDFYQDYARPYHQRFAAMGLRLEDFAADKVNDWAELALRFTLSQPGVTTAIIGSTSPEHTQRNIEYALRPALSDGSVKKLRDAFAAGQKKAGENWPALT